MGGGEKLDQTNTQILSNHVSSPWEWGGGVVVVVFNLVAEMKLKF